MQIIELTDKYKKETERLAAGTWGSTQITAHHELYDLRELPCLIAVSGEQVLPGEQREQAMPEDPSDQVEPREQALPEDPSDQVEPDKQIDQDSPDEQACQKKHKVLGYCYYRLFENEYEIMALESTMPNKGIGSALIGAMISKARNERRSRLYMNTSNDNTHAMRFYQRRGFTMCTVRWNEYDYLRALKPIIPLTGDDDIPLLHEIEFELKIQGQ